MQLRVRMRSSFCFGVGVADLRILRILSSRLSLCDSYSFLGTGTVALANGVTYAGQWQNGLVPLTRLSLCLLHLFSKKNLNTPNLLNRESFIVRILRWTQYHGEGTLTTAQGTYFGGFLNGVMNGHGNMALTLPFLPPLLLQFSISFFTWPLSSKNKHSSSCLMLSFLLCLEL